MHSKVNKITHKVLNISEKVNVEISEFHTDKGISEYHLLVSITDPTLSFLEQFTKIRETYTEVCQNVLAKNAVPVLKRYFLSDACNQADLVTAWECDNSFSALSVVQQAPLNGSKIALWTWFMCDVAADMNSNGVYAFSHNAYTHLFTGGVTKDAVNSEFQTRLLLEDYIIQLAENKCKLKDDCIRTWFFVQNIDRNYDGVVKARKEVFITQDLTQKTHYISSTGIEGRVANSSNLVSMDTYAVKGLKPEQIKFLYAPTHLNPTYEYGVTFERGTTVTYGDRKHIFLSGTASIDNKGNVVHEKNIILQTERMLENVKVLLAEANASFSDIAQAVIYLRDTADYLVVKETLIKNNLDFPHIIVHAPVCRPEWLIEMECIAITSASEKSYSVL